MRALCSVRGPMPAEARSRLSAGARLLSIRVPGFAQALHFVVEAKSRVKDVRTQILAHFVHQGLRESDVFGLALLHDGEYLFLDLESKLSKYAPKSWKSSHTHGLDANGRPLLEIHFAVQFYVDSPLLLKDEMCHHLYYQQLKTNLIIRDVLPTDIVLLLSGLALQADFGDAKDYDERDYFNQKDYTPSSLSGDWVSTAMRACHRDHCGMSKTDAEVRFIREVWVLSDPINSHRYRMRISKTEMEPGSVIMSLSAKGIKILQENNQSQKTFIWSSISKLSFDKKKFEIRTETDKVTLYSCDDEKSKFLLSLCKDTHQFSLKISSKLSEFQKTEEEERRFCFGYNSELQFPYNKNKNEQRVSVISSTSSNTTSGIVSDRVQSEDELEIMIDSPPAPSLESLAFAHLLDNTHKRDNEFIKKASPKTKSQNSEKCETPGSDYLLSAVVFPEPGNLVDKKETFEEPLYKLKCNVSQCSSSCSTVIMARAGIEASRRLSNASSLELSYNHTAQNSMISNSSTFVDMRCNDNEETASTLYDGLGQPVTVAASSETSGVYTMGSSENAHNSKQVEDEYQTEASSSHYSEFSLSKHEAIIDHRNYLAAMNTVGEMSVCEDSDLTRTFQDVDCVDGSFLNITEAISSNFICRSRSNTSLVSFHGDGSDPTDKKHNILSAIELSDLIVGRGAYPKHQSVSDTLDSVSDYVRLPLPLGGESYLKGHEDTAPTDDDYIEDENAFSNQVPPPPPRFDSHKGNHFYSMTDLSEKIQFQTNIPTKPPPPYHFKHNTLNTNNELNKNETHIAKRNENNGEIEVAASRIITSKPIINIPSAKIEQASTPSTIMFASPICIDPFYPKLNSEQSNRAPIPPPRLSRQPPPPPPPRASYLQQLYSDVDFVVYPLQDPSVSQQNYLDSKIINTALNKNNLMCHSSPFLTATALSDCSYGSSQNLSDSYIRLVCRPKEQIMSTFDKTNMKHHRVFKPECELPPLPISRTKSDDNILNSIQSTSKFKTRRPPPPPPYEHKKKMASRQQQGIFKVNNIKNIQDESVNQNTHEQNVTIDITTIREKSKNLDLPLISALCNDKSLIKQTKAFGNSKPSQEQKRLKKISVHSKSIDENLDKCKNESLKKSNNPHTNGKKFLVRNPNDKLPDIPGNETHTPRALSNTYVSHPGVNTKKVIAPL